MYVNLKTSRASIVEMVTVFFPMLASRRPCHSEKKKFANRGVAGGIRERASPPYSLAAGESVSEFAASDIELDSSPILSRLRHSRSRLRYQNKSTRARNPASYAGQYVYTIFLQLLLVVHSLFLPLRFVKELTLVKGPFARLGPNVLKSVLLRVGADQAESNACVTAAVVSVAWR